VKHGLTEYACCELQEVWKHGYHTELDTVTICTKWCCYLEVTCELLLAKVDTAVPTEHCHILCHLLSLCVTSC
jgi:hypothetical protein